MADKAIISWSSGKDAAYALHEVRRAGELEIVGALTTISVAYERVAIHGVRERLLARQLEALGIPLIRVELPTPCTNEVYEREVDRALRDVRECGVEWVVFGDLYLEDVRAYRQAQLGALGMGGVYPLWGRDTVELAREMVREGIRATLTCVDPAALDVSFAGRTFDESLLDDLPAAVDPCGENGEFHTAVWAGPMFDRALDVSPGEIVERDGFVYADLVID